MNPAIEFHNLQSRRTFFQGAGLKLGGIALAQLAGKRTFANLANAPEEDMHPALPGFPNFKPKAKNLIYLHMNGAPAQMDLFDHKPVMEKYFDKDLPDSVRNNQRITGMTSGQARFPVAPSKFKFEKCGKSGIMMSELVPHMKEIADEISMIKSVHTEAINHDPACTFVMTGSEVPGKPKPGFLAKLRAGEYKSGPPGFCGLYSHFSQGQAKPKHSSPACGAVGFFLQSMTALPSVEWGTRFSLSKTLRASIRETDGPCSMPWEN